MRTFILSIAAISAAFLGVSWLNQTYDAALRDPLFLNGWILFGGMAVQLLLRLKKKFPRWIVGGDALWARFHVCMGWFVTLVFALHTNWSVPDTGFEWALWTVFVLVVLSGTFGAYLNRSIPFKLEQNAGRQVFEKIPALQSKIARDAACLALSSVEKTGSPAICDLYVGRLHDFFNRPQNVLAHLKSSRRPIKKILFQIQNLEKNIDHAGQKTLVEMKKLVEAKDRLDFQYAHEAALKAWLFVHVPATYALIVLTILHVSVVYAFTSGTG